MGLRRSNWGGNLVPWACLKSSKTPALAWPPLNLTQALGMPTPPGTPSYLYVYRNDSLHRKPRRELRSAELPPVRQPVSPVDQLDPLPPAARPDAALRIPVRALGPERLSGRGHPAVHVPRGFGAKDVSVPGCECAALQHAHAVVLTWVQLLTVRRRRQVLEQVGNRACSG